MREIKYSKQKGLTLIELVAVMAIFAIIALGCASMLNDIFSYSNQESLSMDNIDRARMALSVFTNEIRNATTGNDGSYPLNQTGDNQIIFYSDFKANNGTVNRIRYYIADNILYKGVVVPTGSPLSYNLSAESVTPVAYNISQAGSPTFYYYDGNYDGSTSALSQPININQARFVKINLMVLSQNTPTDTGSSPISAGAAIRSLKDNSGN